MAESSSTELVCRYLEDAIAAENDFEARLRDFSEEGDDEEVRAVFASHADQNRRQAEKLALRLQELGGNASQGKSFFANLLDLAPRLAQAGHAQEERIAQNLMIGFTIAKGECVMYEALATVADASGDLSTARLARDIQTQATETAEKLWGFLPSRSKIAFNMLTVAEVDPSVETKTVSNRIV